MFREPGTGCPPGTAWPGLGWLRGLSVTMSSTLGCVAPAWAVRGGRCRHPNCRDTGGQWSVVSGQWSVVRNTESDYHESCHTSDEASLGQLCWSCSTGVAKEGCPEVTGKSCIQDHLLLGIFNFD